MKLPPAEFWAAAASPAQIPTAARLEIAVAGRSNVGKSSLINIITSRQRLARTSVTPGCTRGLTFFQLGDLLTLVDLPGYGYAKRSVAERQRWKRLVDHYLAHRRELAAVLVLVDVRRGPEQEEYELQEYLEARGLTHAWVLTKCDKLGRSRLTLRLRKLRSQLAPSTVLASSAVARWGAAELWAWMESVVAENAARGGGGRG